LAKEKYLVVADYSQQKIYQLKPDTGEVRAMITRRCHPDTMTFDPSANVLYMSCVEYISSGMHYHIRRTTFDGTIDHVIYSAQRGKKQRPSARRSILIAVEVLTPCERYYTAEATVTEHYRWHS